ncbi:MAG: nucleotidyltransferase family protein [Vampirovibrionales bacterium]|nr:nucleotidyltransferase family protein [Vampirovibrionales bacterium]
MSTQPSLTASPVAVWPEWLTLTHAEGAPDAGQLSALINEPGGWFKGNLISAMTPEAAANTQPITKIRWHSTIQDPGYYEIELFFGKGGFVASVRSIKQNLVYFLLPGSVLKLPNLELSVPGQLESLPEGSTEAGAQASAGADAQTVTQQAMILGAGIGTRILPLTSDTMGVAKPALPLGANTTVIGQLLLQLARHNVLRCFVNTFYQAQSVIAALDTAERQATQETGQTVCWVNIPEKRATGTAGGLNAILQTPDKFGAFDPQSPVLIVQGDAVTNADFTDLLNAHARSGALLTIGCQRVSDAEVPLFGILATPNAEQADPSGEVTLFLEKPKLEQAGANRLASCGFYVISEALYPLITQVYQQRLADEQRKAQAKGLPEPKTLEELDFAKHVFPAVMAQYKQHKTPVIWAHQMRGFWSDIGNPAQYLQTLQAIESGALHWKGLERVSPAGKYNGVVYWPGTSARVQQEHAELSGNILVAEPHQTA